MIMTNGASLEKDMNKLSNDAMFNANDKVISEISNTKQDSKVHYLYVPYAMMYYTTAGYMLMLLCVVSISCYTGGNGGKIYTHTHKQNSGCHVSGHLGTTILRRIKFPINWLRNLVKGNH